MNETLIPLVWDTGQIGSVAVDARGILRLRRALDDTMTRELGVAKVALNGPSLVPLHHVSPTIDAADMSALLDEFEWHSR